MDESNTKLQKVCITALCYLSFIAYGLICAVLPQTMKDLEKLMSINTSQFSIMYSVKSIFYSFGAVFFGWLFNRLNRQLLFALNMLLVGVTSVLTPLLPYYYIFLLLSSVCGMALGAVDTAANVLILELWGKDNNVYLQALHLFVALGTVIGPLICTPFVSSDNNSTTQVLNIHLSFQTPIESKIIIPFGITGGVAIIAAFGLFIFELIKPYKTPERSLTRQDRRNNTDEEINTDSEQLIITTIPKLYYVILVTTASLFTFTLLCTESTYFNYLPPFLQGIHIERKTSMFMSSAFAGGYTLFRFLSIFIAMKLKPSAMLYISFAITLVSSVAMLAFGLRSVPLLWLTCATTGAGFACLYPTLFSFIEERVDVTNIIAGIFMVAGSTANVITPLIIGSFIEQKPWAFLDFNVVCIVSMIIMFVLLHCTDILKSKYENNNRTQL